MKTYDLVLLQTPLDEGISKLGLIELLEKINNCEGGIVPINFSENNTFAGGFITHDAIEFTDWPSLCEDICEIIGDQRLETLNGEYKRSGLCIYIGYDEIKNLNSKF